MKKVGIITINDFNNYGNRLQNYALQEKLLQLGLDVENILNNNLDTKCKKILKDILCLFQRKKKCEIVRKKNFKNFDKDYMKNTNFTIYKDNVKFDMQEKYDYFIIGSDQVWNYKFNRIPKIDFALFSPKEKNISYAASFGIDNIDKSLEKQYIEGLNNINNISTREERGAEIIKELIGKDVPVVLDPTFLIEDKEWNVIVKKPKEDIKQKYILTYFLGDISNERKIALQKIAEKYNFKIINLGKIEYEQYYTAGPSEFLWYIKNSEIVFTDSFHACVFSIIFDKTFYVLDREDKTKSMNSRIETLLKIFSLQQQRFINWENISLEHDYIQVESVLKEEREKSLKFLKKALDIGE